MLARKRLSDDLETIDVIVKSKCKDFLKIAKNLKLCFYLNA